MKVALQTLGCKLNFAETSTIGRQFVERGFEVVEIDQPADVFVLNTCSVTERADRECRQLIRRTLRRSPDAYVIVIGCYAQLQPEDIAAIDGVDLIIGSKQKFDIFNYTNGFTKKGNPQIFVSCIDDDLEFAPAYSAEVGGRTRAFLKVQDGCDFNCAFCTIPLARGESRSTPIPNIIRQASSIAEQGYREIVITGINVGDYGKRIGTNILELLKELDRIDGVDRIRVSSIEPNILSKEIIDFILASEKFCNHFHIPLQSGSDVILKRMRRRYLTEEYRELLTYIKQKDPTAGIGADVIAGFPGETDELFQDTYNFIFSLPISYLHVFTYSKRPDTLSAGFTDEIEPRIRFNRSETLRNLGIIKRKEFYSSFIGKSIPVLFEGTVRNDTVSGLSSNYIRVEIPGDDSFTNQIHYVKIDSIKEEHCLAVKVDGVSSEDCPPVFIPGPSLVNSSVLSSIKEPS